MGRRWEQINTISKKNKRTDFEKETMDMTMVEEKYY